MKSELIKSEILSESTKAESNRVQWSVESRRWYARPRTNSPFPPLKSRDKPKHINLVKQSESFNASLNRNVLDLWGEQRLSPDLSLLPEYKVINYDDSCWKSFVIEKQKHGSKTRENSANFRINSAQQSNPFVDETKLKMWMSIDKKRSGYRLGEMSAPGSAASYNIQLDNFRRPRGNLNANVKIHTVKKNEVPQSIQIDSSKKAFIDWKAVAVSSSDLNNEEKELLGFSPPYLDNAYNRETKELPSLSFKGNYYKIRIFQNNLCFIENRNASQQPSRLNKSQLLYHNLSKNLHETDYEQCEVKIPNNTSKSGDAYVWNLISTTLFRQKAATAEEIYRHHINAEPAQFEFKNAEFPTHCS